MANAKSHPLFSHARPGQKKKQNKTGFSGANSKDVAGLRMSIFETHTRGFSVFVGLENNAPHPCCIETKTKQKNVELNV